MNRKILEEITQRLATLVFVTTTVKLHNKVVKTVTKIVRGPIEDVYRFSEDEVEDLRVFLYGRQIPRRHGNRLIVRPPLSISKLHVTIDADTALQHGMLSKDDIKSIIMMALSISRMSVKELTELLVFASGRLYKHKS